MSVNASPRAHVWAAIAAMTLLTPSAAEAQASSTQDKVAAAALREDGKDLVKAGKLAEACPKFAESQRLAPDNKTHYYLADCLERSGKLASAWTHYLDVAAEAKAAGQKDRETFARERADALRPKLTRIEITVPDDVRRTKGLRVTKDGAAVSEGQWGSAIPVDPGTYAIAATAPGRTTWKATVDARAAGDTIRVTVGPLVDPGAVRAASPAVLPPAPALATAPAPGAREPAVAPPEETPSASSRVPVYVAYSLAGAGLAVGAIFGIRTAGLHGEYEDRPSQELQDDGLTSAVIADVGFGAAVAFAATGTVLLLMSDDVEAASGASSQRPRWSVGASIAPDSAGAAARLRF